MCLPNIKKLLTSYNLEGQYKLRLVNPYWWIHGRASLIAKLMREHWGVTGNVSQMPDSPQSPRWEICATCYETGKCWRFSRKRMGDFLTNYVVTPNFPLAEAAAASAAVPGLIGPLKLKASKYTWHKYPPAGDEYPMAGREPTDPAEPLAPRLTLWDGGVYDNLGMEPIFKLQGRFRDEVDFLIVSDASRPLGKQFRRFQFRIPPYVPPFRLIDAATDQVRALRVRSFIGFLDKNPRSGLVLRMGNTVDQILGKAKKQRPTKWDGKSFLDEASVQMAAGMETTLRKLTSDEFDRLSNHGYEVAEATLYAYDHTSFDV
jgi:NTE family protein